MTHLDVNKLPKFTVLHCFQLAVHYYVIDARIFYLFVFSWI